MMPGGAGEVHAYDGGRPGAPPLHGAYGSRLYDLPQPPSPYGGGAAYYHQPPHLYAPPPPPSSSPAPSHYGGYESPGAVIYEAFPQRPHAGGGSDEALGAAGSMSADGGAQRFRVKLLADGEAPKDVTCQIGLDGVRMLEPGSGRSLRIYPLETITRWAVKEPAVFTFWAKSAVDFEQRTVRLLSSAYTTTAILDALTAACIQLCEMLGKDGQRAGGGGDAASPSKGGSEGPSGGSEQPRRASSIADWVVSRSRAAAQEEKQHWVPDEAVVKCSSCASDFGTFNRRHHCRNCGDIFCDKCTRGRTPLTAELDALPVRVCDRCLAEVTQRLSNIQEGGGAAGLAKVSSQRTHEDLAKKLRDEMEQNAARQTTSSGGSGGDSSLRSEGSGRTTVVTCGKCSTVSLVPEAAAAVCPACFATMDGGLHGSPAAVSDHRYGNNLGQLPPGPPHLWPASGGGGSTDPVMRNVACPTCTVHLQVQIPAHGTETVECGVCQHPFLVAANS